MKALSIRQPWAWLIIHGGKDIENRDWPTKIRGRILVHAAKGMTRDEYDSVLRFSARKESGNVFHVPPFDHLRRGGLIGSVEITDCVTQSTSLWFFGKFGFVLRDPWPLPFTPYRGQLGFFDVPDTAIKKIEIRNKGNE